MLTYAETSFSEAAADYMRGMAASTPPSRAAGQSLPYSTSLSPDDFESLCSDLLEAQDDVVDAHLNGLPRKHEHGVDVLGIRNDGTRIGLQAKRYKAVPKGRFEEWTKEFLASADYWLEQGLDRFVIAVTVDLRSSERQAEVEACARLCLAAGIEFEVWHQRRLDRLLKKQPDIIRDYFGEDWELAFCIAPKSAPTRTQAQVRIELQDKHLARDVAELVEVYERGDQEAVAAGLSRLDSATRMLLAEDDQRTILRIEALQALGRQDEIAVGKILQNPLLLGDQDLLAIRDLTFESGGDIEAIIAARPNISELVRAQLLLVLGRPGDAAEALADARSPSEVAIRARAEFARGDRTLALELAAETVDASEASISAIGSVFAVQFASCTVAGFDFDPGNFPPMPFPFGMVRCDREAVSRLETILAGVRRSPSERGRVRGGLDRAGFEVAALCCLPDRRSEAEALLAENLLYDVPSAAAIAWAVHSGLTFDVPHAINAVRRTLKAAIGGSEHLFVTVGLLELEGRIDDARTTLNRFAGKFRSVRGFASMESYWRDRLVGKVPADELDTLMQAAARSGDWQQAVDRVNAGLVSHSTMAKSELLRLGQMLVSHERWTELDTLLDEVEKVRTQESLKIAALGWRGYGQPREVLRVLADAEATGQPISRDLVHLRADALEAIGSTAEALLVRRSLTLPDVMDRTSLGGALLRAGKVAEAASVFDSIVAEDVPSGFRIHVAAALRPFRADVARRLIEPLLVAREVPDEHLGDLIDLAGKLGVQERADFAFSRMASGEASGVLRFDSVEEILAFTEDRRRHLDQLTTRHLEGSLSIAHFAQGVSGTVAGRVFGIEDGPVFVRHGSRLPRHSVLNHDDVIPEGLRAFPKRLPKTVVLDYPAVLIAHRFGLLTPILARSDRVLIPPSLPAAIAEDLMNIDPGGRSADSVLRDAIDACKRITEISPHDFVVVARIDVDSNGEAVEACDLAATILGERTGENGPAALPIHLSEAAFFELARLGILGEVVDRFVTYVPRGLPAKIERCVEEEGRRWQVCSSLRELSSFLDEELTAGRLETVIHSAGQAMPQRVSRTSADRTLVEVLSMEGQSEDVAILSGDRFLNGYGSVGTTAILDLETVISLIESEGALQETKGREARYQMRLADFHYLADPAPDAIHAASSRDFGAFGATSTKRFDAIRRNMASAVAMSRHLRIDGTSGHDGQGSEASIVRDAALTSLEVVRAVWTGRNLTDAAVITASNAAVDDLMFVRVPGNPAEQTETNATSWAAQTYGFLLGTVFIIATHDHRRVRPFLDWFEARCAYDMLLDPVISLIAIRACETALSGLVSFLPATEPKKLKKVDRFLAAVASNACLALPIEIVRRFDEALLRRVGVNRLQTMDVGGHSVTPEALRDALRDRSSERFVSTEAGESLKLLVRDGGAFALEAENVHYVFSDPEFDLLAIDPHGSPGEAIDRVSWLGTTAEAERVLAVLRNGCSPTGLGDAARSVYGSIPASLSRLAASHDEIGRNEFLPPDPEILFRALGIRPDDDVAALDRTPSSADKQDVLTILQNRLHLPRRLDRSAYVASVLSSEEMEMGLASAKGLVARHVARMSAKVAGGPSPTISKFDFELLTALVRWTLRRLDRDPRWLEVSDPLRLVAAWFHSGRVHEALGGEYYGQDDKARCAAIVDAWEPPAFVVAMGNDATLTRDVCGKGVRGSSIALSFAMLDPSAAVLEELLAQMEVDKIAMLAETTIMPDLMGSLVSEARANPPTWLVTRKPLLVPEYVEGQLRDGLSALSETRGLEAWITSLYVLRRGADPTTRDRLLDLWRDVDYPSRCALDPKWVAAGQYLLDALGQALQVKDYLELLSGCREATPWASEPLIDRSISELKAQVAIHSARLPDDEWQSVVETLVNGLEGERRLWRHTLSDRMFDRIIPRPDRVADLLRRLRATDKN